MSAILYVQIIDKSYKILTSAFSEASLYEFKNPKEILDNLRYEVLESLTPRTFKINKYNISIISVKSYYLLVIQEKNKGGSELEKLISIVMSQDFLEKRESTLENEILVKRFALKNIINEINENNLNEDSLKLVSKNLDETKEMIGESLNRVVRRGENLENIGIMAEELEGKVKSFRRDVNKAFNDDSMIKKVVGAAFLIFIIVFFLLRKFK